MRTVDELLREDSGKQCAVQLHEVWQVHGESVLQRPLHDGMAAAERKDPEARQEVEVPRSVAIEQVGALPRS